MVDSQSLQFTKHSWVKLALVNSLPHIALQVSRVSMIMPMQKHIILTMFVVYWLSQ